MVTEQAQAAGDDTILGQNYFADKCACLLPGFLLRVAHIHVAGTVICTAAYHEEVIRPSLDPVRNARHVTLASLRTALISAMPDLDVGKVDFMFDTARKNLEAAAWHKLKKPWKATIDPATRRKYYYNVRTLESRWFMPILERQTGTH